MIAVDLPGFGGSEPPAPGSEIDVYAETLVALLDQLGAETAVVTGHSLGGLVSCRLALTHPDRVRALVLVNAGGVAIGPAPARRDRPRLPRLQRDLLATGCHSGGRAAAPAATRPGLTASCGTRAR